MQSIYGISQMKRLLTRRLEEVMKEDFDIPASEVDTAAAHAGMAGTCQHARDDMRKKGRRNTRRG